MYKYLLESAGNINWMALFALFTFLFVFIVAAVMALRKNTKEIERIASLPLQDDHLV